MKRFLSLCIALTLGLSTTSASATSYYRILIERQRAKEGAKLVREQQPRFVKVGTKAHSQRRSNELRRIETKAGEQAKEACIVDEQGTFSPDFLACFKKKKAEIYNKLKKESEESTTAVMDPLIIERAKIERETKRYK